MASVKVKKSSKQASDQSSRSRRAPTKTSRSRSFNPRYSIDTDGNAKQLPLDAKELVSVEDDSLDDSVINYFDYFRPNVSRLLLSDFRQSLFKKNSPEYLAESIEVIRTLDHAFEKKSHVFPSDTTLFVQSNEIPPSKFTDPDFVRAHRNLLGTAKLTAKHIVLELQLGAKMPYLWSKHMSNGDSILLPRGLSLTPNLKQVKHVVVGSVECTIVPCRVKLNKVKSVPDFSDDDLDDIEVMRRTSQKDD